MLTTIIEIIKQNLIQKKFNCTVNCRELKLIQIVKIKKFNFDCREFV